jgi:hypothetical protein
MKNVAAGKDFDLGGRVSQVSLKSQQKLRVDVRSIVILFMIIIIIIIIITITSPPPPPPPPPPSITLLSPHSRAVSPNKRGTQRRWQTLLRLWACKAPRFELECED